MILMKNVTYKESTPKALVDILERYRARHRLGQYFHARLTFVYSSHKEHGYIGNITGEVRTPILVHNRRSLGGYILDTENVLEVREARGGRLLWSRTDEQKEGSK